MSSRVIYMLEKELNSHIKALYPKENENCEWKEFKNLKHNVSGHPGDDLISYVSAISNMEGGHIVLGVENNTLEIIGIQEFNNHTKDNISLTLLDLCANLPSEGLDVDEYHTEDTDKIIWVIHVPKHMHRLPVYANKKAWYRKDEHLMVMDKSRLDAIINEIIIQFDWSAEIVEEATLADLDEEALVKARFEFKRCHPRIADEVDEWDDIMLLNKAGVAVRGKLTRAALLLLGKDDSVHMLRPSVAQISWILMDDKGEKIDYEHKTIPFLLTVDKVLSLVRNLTSREMPGGTLFPDTMKQYDDYSIREALHNCIAHQDYTMQQRVVLVEKPDSLTFSNCGLFLPGTIEKAIEQDGPQKYYRNYCLCQGMVAFNMIDTIGRGVKKIFTQQQKRFFPMPDYVIDNINKEVSVCIYGKVLNTNYVNLLRTNPDITLSDCIILDAVQKGKVIPKELADKLKKKKFLEGRYPNIYISEKVAKETNQIPEYVKQKGLSRKYYKDMVLQLLAKNKNGAKRSVIDTLLVDMVPKSSKSPQSYIGNILSEMKNKDKTIDFIEDKRLWVKL